MGKEGVMMNRTFMLGYYQGVVETAPAILSAAKTAELATTMTIQHLRHAHVDSVTINNFLIDDAHVDPRLVAKYINCSPDELETIQANLLKMAY